jgi:glycosyltransferase involved in cell wall biosynthesis
MWELLRHVEEVWTSSPNREILRKLGLPEGRFRGFDWGLVKTDEFRPREDSVEYVEDEDVTVIGSFRRIRNLPLVPSYRDFLDAVEILHDNRDDFHVVIGGFQEDKTEAQEEVDEMIEARGLSDVITRLEMLPKDELPRYYAGLDVYIDFSPEGNIAGIGTAAKEGMSSGCAFVTFDDPSPEYIIEDGENGIVVPRGDPEKFAHRLQKLCESPELVEQLSNEARRTIVEEHSPDAIRDKVYNACREIHNEYRNAP